MRRLIIRPGAIGDTILSLPALEFLKADFTEIWVRSEICPLVRFADRTRSIASTGIDLLGLTDVEPPASLIESLKSFDEIVTWYGATRPEFRSALGSFCNSCRFLPALPDGSCHAADFFLWQAGGTGRAIPNLRNETNFHGSVVIHPLSGSARKTWPMEQFVELESRLGVPVEWAARPDWLLFDNLFDLASWLSGARLFVGNDSGIMHLAAACGIPVVGLFGNSDPAIWGPRSVATRVVRAASMSEISVDMVVAQVEDLLASAA